MKKHESLYILHKWQPCTYYSGEGNEATQLQR